MKTIEELKKEQYDAKAKLHELIEFINSEGFYSLSSTEKSLISQERTGLELYLSSLTRRIYGNPCEPDASNMIWLSLLYGMFNTNGFGSTGSLVPPNEKLVEKDFDGDSLSDHTV